MYGSTGVFLSYHVFVSFHVLLIYREVYGDDDDDDGDKTSLQQQ